MRSTCAFSKDRTLHLLILTVEPVTQSRKGDGLLKGICVPRLEKVPEQYRM